MKNGLAFQFYFLLPGLFGWLFLGLSGTMKNLNEMAETTSISWCDATVNFWHGCQKVSEGCKFCYMYRDKEKYGQDGNEIKKTQLKTIHRILTELNKQYLQRLDQGITEPLKIFTCSWSDFFLEQADHWREEAWKIIEAFQQFTWIILTKRPELISDRLPANWGKGWDNVWLLVSAENQARADERIPILLDVPAKVRGVSVEPILGPVDLTNYLYSRFIMGGARHEYNSLDWVIVGGESGNNVGKWQFRISLLDWYFKIINDCQNAKVAVFVKQLGTHISNVLHLKDRHGENWTEWPAKLHELRIRQFPQNLVYG